MLRQTSVLASYLRGKVPLSPLCTLEQAQQFFCSGDEQDCFFLCYLISISSQGQASLGSVLRLGGEGCQGEDCLGLFLLEWAKLPGVIMAPLTSHPTPSFFFLISKLGGLCLRPWAVQSSLWSAWWLHNYWSFPSSHPIYTHLLVPEEHQHTLQIPDIQLFSFEAFINGQMHVPGRND